MLAFHVLAAHVATVGARLLHRDPPLLRERRGSGRARSLPLRCPANSGSRGKTGEDSCTQPKFNFRHAVANDRKWPGRRPGTLDFMLEGTAHRVPPRGVTVGGCPALPDPRGRGYHRKMYDIINKLNII